VLAGPTNQILNAYSQSYLGEAIHVLVFDRRWKATLSKGYLGEAIHVLVFNRRWKATLSKPDITQAL